MSRRLNTIRLEASINCDATDQSTTHETPQPINMLANNRYFFCWTAQRDSQQLRVCWVGQAQRWNPPALPPQGLSWFIQFVATVDCTNANFMGQATFLPFGAVPKNVCSAVVAVQIKKHAFRLFREPSLVSMAPWPHSPEDLRWWSPPCGLCDRWAKPLPMTVTATTHGRCFAGQVSTRRRGVLSCIDRFGSRGSCVCPAGCVHVARLFVGEQSNHT